MTPHLEFNLLDNALDYVLSAAEHARKDTPRDLKYAILHLAAGIELLLKARLEKEHWSLLFADVDKADAEALKTGDLKSVDFETACKRLSRIAGVELPNAVLKHLNDLRKVRNKVQHLVIRTPIEQVRSLVGQGHNFVLEFVAANLADEAHTHRQELDEIRNQLNELEAFIKARLEALKHELDAAGRLVDCPRCWQETMAVEDDEPHCLFCGHHTDWESLALERSEAGDVKRCPGCGEMSCALVVFNNEEAGWYCIHCDTGGDYVECSRCGVALMNRDDGVCAECWDDVMSRD